MRGKPQELFKVLLRTVIKDTGQRKASSSIVSNERQRKASRIVSDYGMLASKQPGTRSGNDRIEHKDSNSTPKDKARTGGSSLSTPAETPRHMVKGHVVIKKPN